MGTDFCPGLNVKRTYTAGSKNEKRFDSILKIYVNNDMSIENVLKSLSCTMSKQYIARMKAAKDVYSTAKIFDPKEMKITFDKPNLNMIKKICTDIGLISVPDLEIALNLIQSAFNKSDFDQKIATSESSESSDSSHHFVRQLDKHITGKRLIDYNDQVKFSSFASYRAKHIRQSHLKSYNSENYRSVNDSVHGHRFVHNRQFPEPMTRIPITVPCKISDKSH
jgi:hypothetical protein